MEIGNIVLILVLAIVLFPRLSADYVLHQFVIIVLLTMGLSLEMLSGVLDFAFMAEIAMTLLSFPRTVSLPAQFPLIGFDHTAPAAAVFCFSVQHFSSSNKLAEISSSVSIQTAIFSSGIP